MANPNQQYPHPGPSYYNSPPPPQFAYGPSPGAMPYYPFPMNPMNGHSPPHQPASPRLNSGRGGYHPHRAGGPSYPHYPHIPPAQFLQHQPMGPHTPVPPGSQYPPPPQKYSPHPQQMPYVHAYHPSASGPYNTAWPTQTLSPLPKQLSMPAQLPTPTSATGSPAPPPPAVVAPEHVLTVAEFVPGKKVLATLPTPREPSEPPPPTSHPEVSPSPPPALSSPMESAQLSQPSLSEASHAPIARSPTPKSPASTTSRMSHSQSGMSSTFVVWSRIPRDPSKAAGVIISSRANPPPSIIENALDLRTPPQSPKLRPKDSLSALMPHDCHRTVESAPPVESVVEAVPPPPSSATETTPRSSAALDTPVPGSPVSSHTSVSLTTDSTTAPIPEAKQPSPAESLVRLPEDASSSVAQPPPPADAEKATEASSSSTSTSSTSLEPAKAAVPPPKKSWASLLQSSDATASSSKSRLPTSTVVGFSIPAGLPNGTPVLAPSSTNPVQPELLKLLNQGPSGPASPPKTRPRGLVNSGNMCFANVILQTFVYCAPFHRLFTELGKYISGPVVGPQKEGSAATPLVDAIIQFLKEFAPKEPSNDSKSKGKEREEDFDDLDSFMPTYVYDVMKEKKRFASMVGGHQEDAEEFLGFFLDTVEEELLSLTQSYNPKTETVNTAASPEEGWMEVGKKNRLIITRSTKSSESPITRIFGGKFRSTLKAPHQKDSVTVEDWRSLRLDIQREQVNTIKDALQYISHPHSVEITTPTRPGVIIEAQRQELIEILPPVLILHLKRFLYDTSVGDVVKIGKHVTFGPDLEIGPDLLSPTRRTSQPVKYQLFGALYHHGQSASGGHYTLDVLHPNRDMNDRPRQAWIRIDDELVSDVRPEDVFGGQERDDRCAYLLFYRRLGPAKQ